MTCPEEEAELRGYIEEHVACTGSTVGQRVLDDWANSLPKFVKVQTSTPSFSQPTKDIQKGDVSSLLRGGEGVLKGPYFVSTSCR